ncbi:MAG: hypothetical protein AB1782_15080 [Cyanobacteriota bacterium]
MQTIDFTKYADKYIKFKYYILIAIMWVILYLQYLAGMKMLYLFLIGIMITISALSLYGYRSQSCFNNKYRLLEIKQNELVFTFDKPKKTETHKLAKIKKVYLTNVVRRGKKLNPYHFFLTFELSQKNTVSSIEIPTGKVFEFIDDFNKFIEFNKLNLEINNLNELEEKLGPDVYKYFYSLHYGDNNTQLDS